MVETRGLAVLRAVDPLAPESRCRDLFHLV